MDVYHLAKVLHNMKARKCKSKMPFRYRLQKVLDFRIRKKEEQLMVVQKAQQAVFEAEENIRKNNEEIRTTQENMRHADPMMFEVYDKYLIHLWEKGEKLEEIRAEAQKKLDYEKQVLVKLEQAVKVLEKHKEHKKEEYLYEEKMAELKVLNEIGSQKHFARKQEQKETEENEQL